MNLHFEFVLLGVLIILALIPLYIYRREIYKRFVKKGDIDIFLKELKLYLINTYPKIEFNFKILERVEKDEDLRLKEILIVEDMVKQFSYFEYELTTQGSVEKERLWNNYNQNSRVLKDNKYPSDWSQRKEAAWSRDKYSCNRCGTKLGLVDANTLLVKDLKDGGGFNLENIAILCNDCTRIIKSENIEKTRKDLKILETLMKSN